MARLVAEDVRKLFAEPLAEMGEKFAEVASRMEALQDGDYHWLPINHGLSLTAVKSLLFHLEDEFERKVRNAEQGNLRLRPDFKEREPA